MFGRRERGKLEEEVGGDMVGLEKKLGSWKRDGGLRPSRVWGTL